MVHYIALVHKDPDSCFGVSFPDLPGVVTAGDTADEALQQAADVLRFAAEDWINPDGTTGLKPPRSIDSLRDDPEFVEQSRDALLAYVELPGRAHAAE